MSDAGGCGGTSSACQRTKEERPPSSTEERVEGKRVTETRAQRSADVSEQARDGDKKC